jgi:hypothetical protein
MTGGHFIDISTIGDDFRRGLVNELDNMRSPHTSFAIACAASGVFWGALATAVAHVAKKDITNVSWQVMLASVLIGTGIGLVSPWFYSHRRSLFLFWSVASLYVGVASLAAIGGIHAAVFGPPLVPPMSSGAIVAYWVFMLLWVFTRGLFVVYFLPLSVMNHVLLRKLANGRFRNASGWGHT